MPTSREWNDAAVNVRQLQAMLRGMGYAEISGSLCRGVPGSSVVVVGLRTVRNGAKVRYELVPVVSHGEDGVAMNTVDPAVVGAGAPDGLWFHPEYNAVVRVAGRLGDVRAGVGRKCKSGLDAVRLASEAIASRCYSVNVDAEGGVVTAAHWLHPLGISLEPHAMPEFDGRNRRMVSIAGSAFQPYAGRGMGSASTHRIERARLYNETPPVLSVDCVFSSVSPHRAQYGSSTHELRLEAGRWKAGEGVPREVVMLANRHLAPVGRIYEIARVGR